MAAAALLLAGPLAAQEAAAPGEGPIVIGARQKVDPFHLEIPTGYLELDYRREADTQSSPGSTNTTFTENRFQETINLRTNGYVVHPNLLELSLSGSFGLEQDLIDSSGKSETDTSILYDYDLEATFLRKEEAPLTVYTRRSTNTVGRTFGPSLDETLTTSGAILDWRNKTVPTRLEYYHMTQDQQSVDKTESFNQSQDTATWHSEYRPAPNNAWALDYSFTNGNSSSALPSSAGGSNNTTFTTHDASLTNDYAFGSQGRYTLSSSFNFLDQTGTFELQRYRLNEVLRLRHTDNFETNFRYTLDDETTGGQLTGGEATHQLLQRVEGQFIHHLFKSLTTTGTAGLQKVDETTGGSTDYFGRLNFDYVKKVPFGRFTGGLGFGYDLTDNQARGKQTAVVDQPAAFADPLPIVIPGTNIVANSLVVTDASGLVVYRPGFDYTTRTFPDHLQIDRVLGGRIASGQPLLLDYLLAPQAANSVTTTSFSVAGRYDLQQGWLRGLGVYGRFIDISQSISSDVPSQFVPNSLTDLTAGIDYRVWELFFNAEQEYHHSTIAPYDQSRFSANWLHRFRRDASATLNATFTHTTFLDNNDQLDAITVLASAQYELSRDLSANASISYQDQNDKLYGKTTGLEEDAEIRWSHRQTFIFVRFRNSQLTSRSQDNTYQTLEIGVRRNF
jgi:hypothetical protein